MAQLAEAVADAELALSLDPSNKEIETQLKGLKVDLRDASTAKELQQQLQQPATASAAPSENLSPQDVPLPDANTQSPHAKPPSLSSSSPALLASASCPSNSAASTAKPTSEPLSSVAGPAAAPTESSAPPLPHPASVDPRLVSANSLLQVRVSRDMPHDYRVISRLTLFPTPSILL